MLLFHKLLSLLTMVILVGCSHRLGGEKQELIESADSLYRAGEYSAAVTPAMQLLELAREDGDHYLCGQAEDLLADTIYRPTASGHTAMPCWMWQ